MAPRHPPKSPEQEARELAALYRRYGAVRVCKTCRREVFDRVHHWECPRCGVLAKGLHESSTMTVFPVLGPPAQLELPFGEARPGLAKAKPSEPPPEAPALESEQQAPKRRRET
jgi:ribosomal protein L37AE/L43A